MAKEEKKKIHPAFIKNAKAVGILVAVIVAGVVVAIGAMRARNKKAPEMQVPQVDMRSGTKQATETQRYSQVLQQSNQKGYDQAVKQGNTFIPALSDRAAKVESTNDADALEADLQQRLAKEGKSKRIDYARPNDRSSEPVNDQQRQQQAQANQQSNGQVSSGVQSQAERLLAAWEPPTQSVLGLAKEQKQGQGDQATASVQGMSATAANSQASAQTQGKAENKTPYISATDVIPADLISPIDTDVPNAKAIAECRDGKYAGARFMGVAKLQNEVVTIDFDKMKLPKSMGGYTVTISASSVMEDLSPGVPANIDHRYGQRVGIPALLGATGAAGTVYANSGNIVNQGPLGGTTSVTNPNPGGKQIAGAAVSGGIQATQQVIQQETQGIPPKRGTTPKDRPVSIGIQFNDDVFLH